VNLLHEFARVLQPGGTLLITVPNVLNARARLSFMLNAHSSFSRAPITEHTHVRTPPGGDQLYLGHAFMVSYFQLRLYLLLAGFRLLSASSGKYSMSATLLAPFLWLPARLATARLLKRYVGKKAPAIIDEMMGHVMSADMFRGKKLYLLAEKPAASDNKEEAQP
jgi:hypothetical protein